MTGRGAWSPAELLRAAGNVAPEADPVRTLSLGGVVLSTAVLSFSTLRELAMGIGLDKAASLLFPIGFDAAVLCATRAWLHPHLSARTRRYAAAVALFTIAASVAGNSIWHWHEMTTAGQSLWWVIVVISFSALVPLVLGLMIHLAALIQADGRARRVAEAAAAREAATVAVAAAARVATRAATPARTRRPAAPAEPVTPGELPPGVTDVSQMRTARERITQVWKEARAAGETLTYVEVDRRAGTVGYAKKILPRLIEEERAGQATGVADG